MDMRFGTWDVRSLYRTGSLTTVAMELHLMVVLDIGWEKGSTERAEDYTFFYGRGVGIID
jgi:hypothetical protein